MVKNVNILGKKLLLFFFQTSSLEIFCLNYIKNDNYFCIDNDI